jgi:threonine/homoserine/homoserine lactone efflux protein
MTLAQTITWDYLVTAVLVVLAPGTGVLYTLSVSVFRGAIPGIVAAFGCTLGIVPSLTASLLGLAAVLHASALAFQTLKWLGIAYLLYLAWGLWRDRGAMALSEEGAERRGLVAIAVHGVLINCLNPKLTIFFMAFLPQFVPADAPNYLSRMGLLSAVFMGLTFIVFVGYGLCANALRSKVLGSERASLWLKRTFAAGFAVFAARLAITER